MALDQGRYTWRHNSVLSSIIDAVRTDLKEGFTVFSDLEGFLAPHGGVVPPHILVTRFKPDLFLVNETTKEIVLMELTCPWDTNIERSHNYKEEKYAPLVADLSRKFFTFLSRFPCVARFRRAIGLVSNLLSTVAAVIQKK